MVKSFQMFPFL